jgi:ABC-type transport system involved in multi-copper enzyme maturation permease subunit
MTLAGLLILLLIVGVVLYFVPVEQPIRNVIYAVLVILFVLWLLAAFGVVGDWGYVHHERVIVR